ncbi:Rid family hydrolase [Rhizobium sp. BK181]|uniref:Rid family hydrolase n=1 Tax=unclassified Rhizobium TaxID=2613769 RepID=UPI0028A72B5C|nr:Rid family hydrolase [Rhizobium sp. BK181]
MLERVDALLSAEGTDKSDLIQANIWLRDLRSFAEMNTVWERWVPPGITPRRTTFEAHKYAPNAIFGSTSSPGGGARNLSHKAVEDGH